MTLDNNKPMYLQIANLIEDEILSGVLKEGDQVSSVADFVRIYNVNPQTANKGLNHLEAKGIVYMKKGLGTFVEMKARERLERERKNNFEGKTVKDLVYQAKLLKISEDSLLKLVQKTYNEVDV